MSSPVVIDTDGACDDALALWLADASEQLDITLVTTVAGAVSLEVATSNILSLLDQLGLSQVPVYAGAAAPQTRELESSEAVLGVNGMSGLVLPQPSRSVTGWSAADALVAAGGELQGRDAVLVALGPLTNIAAAIELDPDFLTRFGRVMIMGTATDGQGNITPDAEFNTWVDPEAAAAVFAAPGHATVVGWQACRTSGLVDPALHDRMVANPSPFGSFLLKSTAALRQFSKEMGSDSYDLADLLAMAVVLNPELIEQTAVGQIEVDPAVRGRTTLVRNQDNNRSITDNRSATDSRSITENRSATVVETADLAGFAKLVADMAIAAE